MSALVETLWTIADFVAVDPRQAGSFVYADFGRVRRIFWCDESGCRLAYDSSRETRS